MGHTKNKMKAAFIILLVLALGINCELMNDLNSRMLGKKSKCGKDKECWKKLYADKKAAIAAKKAAIADKKRVLEDKPKCEKSDKECWKAAFAAKKAAWVAKKKSMGRKKEGRSQEGRRQ